jgi:hypothetical protein
MASVEKLPQVDKLLNECNKLFTLIIWPKYQIQAE